MRVDKRIIVFLLVVVISVASVGIVYYFYSGVAIEFQWEKTVSNEMDDFDIWVDELSNCIIDIGISEDESLLYSIIITLDKPGRVDTDEYSTSIGLTEDFVFFENEASSQLIIRNTPYGSAKIKHVDIILGNTVPFDIYTGGYNVTVNARYDNEANLDTGSFWCGGDSSLNLEITEDVVYSGSKMELIIDANVLMSALVKAKGFTYDLIFNDKIKLSAPELLLSEFEKHKEEITKKSNLSKEELDLFLSLISARIDLIPLSEFKNQIDHAERISPDPDDTEYLALALKLNCPIWSNDKKLKEQEIIKIYSTEELIKII